MSELDTLLEQAASGDRNAALVLWQEGTAQGNVDIALKGAGYLGHDEKVRDWLHALLQEPFDHALEELGRALGVELTESGLTAFKEALTRANGNRRSSVMSEEKACGLLAAFICDPTPPYFEAAYATAAGTTVFFAGMHKDQLLVAMRAYHPGHRWRTDNYHILPKLSSLWPDAFDGWEDWDQAEQQQAFDAWAPTQDDLIAFQRTEASYQQTKTGIATFGNDILSTEENALLAAALKELEAEIEPHKTEEEWSYARWLKMCDVLKAKPGCINEILLTLLVRVLDGWDDGYRFFCSTKRRPSKSEKQIYEHLARTFDLQEKLNKAHQDWITEGALRNTRRLRVSRHMNDANFVFAHSPDLENLRHVSLYIDEIPNEKVLQTFASDGIWQQITSLDIEICPDYLTPKEVKKQELLCTKYLAPLIASCGRLLALRLVGAKLNSALARAIIERTELCELEMRKCSLTEAAEIEWQSAFPEHLEALVVYDTESASLLDGSSDSSPLRQLAINFQSSDSIKDIDGCMAGKRLAQLETLNLEAHAGLRGLARHANLPLRKLDLYIFGTLAKSSCQALLTSPGFRHLQQLHIFGRIELDDVAFIKGLLQAPHLRSLRSISVGGMWLLAADIPEVFATAYLPALEELHLSGVEKIDAAGGKAIANCTGLPNLTKLTLNTKRSVFKKAREAIEQSSCYPRGLEFVTS